MKATKAMWACLALLSLGFASCEEKNGNTEASIVGTWKYAALEHDIQTSDETLTATINAAVDEVAATMDMTYTFDEQGTYTATSSMDGEPETWDGTYTYADGLLALDELDTLKCALTDTQMRLSASLEDMVGDLSDLEQGGIQILRADLTVVFDKQ